MGEQKPRVDHVERSVHRVVDTTDPILDVGDATGHSFRPGNLDLRGVHVDAEHFAVRADTSGQLQCRVSASAAGIEARHSALEPDAVEQSRRALVHDAGENPEPLATLDATANNVARRIAHLDNLSSAPRRYCVQRARIASSSVSRS